MQPSDFVRTGLLGFLGPVSTVAILSSDCIFVIVFTIIENKVWHTQNPVEIFNS